MQQKSAIVFIEWGSVVQDIKMFFGSQTVKNFFFYTPKLKIPRGNGDGRFSAGFK